MTTYEDSVAGGLPYRLRQVERVTEALQAWRGVVDTTLAERGVQQKNMEDKLDHLATAVESLRKVILGFAISVAGSAIVFALSVLIATGKIGK